MKIKWTRAALSLCAALLVAEAVAGVALLTGGCGAGAVSTSGKQILSRGASAQFTIYWPTATRVIPLGASSVKVVVEAMDPVSGSWTSAADPKIVPRPATPGTSSVEFTGLPIGHLRFTATAYPNADASGTEQAVGMGELTSEDVSKPLDVSITMDSTVTRVTVDSPTVSIPKGTVKSLIVTAYDAKGRVVLTAPSAWHWESNVPSTVLAPTGGTVDGTAGTDRVMGSISGLNVGTATITVRYTEAPDGDGNTARSVVTVTDTPTTTGSCRDLPTSCAKPYPIHPQPCTYQCHNSTGQTISINGYTNGCGYCIEEPK